jgi:hypothetical protein
LIERLVENWLDNVNERGYEAAFCQALSARGYRIVHRSSHGPMEQGKDVIAIAQSGEVCAYQLKTGNIDQRFWREITGEVVDLVESGILHPNIGPGVRFKPYLVTNGQITDAVRLDIFAKNAAWQVRDREPLQLILKDELFKWFVDLQGRFLPTTPVDFQRFLGLYLAEKRDMLDKAAFCEFLESFLPIDEDVKRSEIRRIFAATAVIANYVLSGFQVAKNHLAVAEGWMVVIAYLLRIAESFKGYRRLWGPFLELCVASMDSALEDLAEEALASKYFVQGDPSVDLRFVPIRTTIVLGWLAGFSIYRRLKDCKHPQDFEMYGKVLDHFRPHVLDLWGEAAAPCFLAMVLLVWCYGREGRACRMATSVIRTIFEANGQREAVGLPDAYFQPKELIDAFVKGESPFGYGQSFTGRSQSIQTFIEFIARRHRKKILQQQWYGISDIDLAEFVPTNPADIYRWRCKKGDSQTRKWARPQEWSVVLETAEQKRTPELLLCSIYPELLPIFFLVFPHRMTPHLSRFLDHAVINTALD